MVVMKRGSCMRNDMERRFAGKRAKLTGELFEKLVEASCRHYRETGQAVIEKTPEPMKPLSGMDSRGRFQACFTKNQHKAQRAHFVIRLHAVHLGFCQPVIGNGSR